MKYLLKLSKSIEALTGGSFEDGGRLLEFYCPLCRLGEKSRRTAREIGLLTCTETGRGERPSAYYFNPAMLEILKDLATE